MLRQKSLFGEQMERKAFSNAMEGQRAICDVIANTLEWLVTPAALYIVIPVISVKGLHSPFQFAKHIQCP